MNTTLSIATLIDHIHEASGAYLFPLLVGVALLVVLAVLAFGRGNDLPQNVVPEPAPVPPGPPTIDVLVVDDSAVVRAKLRKLLEGAGYSVALARDGLEALEALAATHFAVMVTDLEMPNMDGMELMASVQGSLDTEDLPIIAITGHDEMQAHVRDYQCLYGIFKKPWNDRDLLKRIEALVTLRAKPSPARALRPATPVPRRV